MTLSDDDVITFLDRINMIKKIKKIWDCRGASSSMRRFALMVLFFLILCATTGFGMPKAYVDKDEAIEIAIHSAHVSLSDRKVSASEGSGLLPSDHTGVYSMLKDKSYWKVVFKLKTPSDSGDVIVFIDRFSGKILLTVQTR